MIRNSNMIQIIQTKYPIGSLQPPSPNIVCCLNQKRLQMKEGIITKIKQYILMDSHNNPRLFESISSIFHGIKDHKTTSKNGSTPSMSQYFIPRKNKCFIFLHLTDNERELSRFLLHLPRGHQQILSNSLDVLLREVLLPQYIQERVHDQYLLHHCE